MPSMDKEYVLIYVLLVSLCRIQLKNAKLYAQLASPSLLPAIVLLDVLVILKPMAITKFATIAVLMLLIIYMLIILQVYV